MLPQEVADMSCVESVKMEDIELNIFELVIFHTSRQWRQQTAPLNSVVSRPHNHSVRKINARPLLAATPA